MNDTPPQAREQRRSRRDAFIDYLLELQEEGDRASLAILRRGLMDFGRDFAIYRVVGYKLPYGVLPWQTDLYLLTACLFAMHGIAHVAEDDKDSQSLGRSMRTIRQQIEAELKEGSKSLDQRFAAILNSDAIDLPIRLRHLFSLLKAKEVAVDYYTLLSDLLAWNAPSRYVQKRWARDYWTGEDDDKNTPSEQTNEAKNMEASAD